MIQRTVRNYQNLKEIYQGKKGRETYETPNAT
jgi:hypothetical protein